MLVCFKVPECGRTLDDVCTIIHVWVFLTDDTFTSGHFYTNKLWAGLIFLFSPIYFVEGILSQTSSPCFFPSDEKLPGSPSSGPNVFSMMLTLARLRASLAALISKCSSSPRSPIKRPPSPLQGQDICGLASPKVLRRPFWFLRVTLNNNLDKNALYTLWFVWKQTQQCFCCTSINRSGLEMQSWKIILLFVFFILCFSPAPPPPPPIPSILWWRFDVRLFFLGPLSMYFSTKTANKSVCVPINYQIY